MAPPPRPAATNDRRAAAVEGLRTPAMADGGAAGAIDRATVERLTATMGGEFVGELIHTFIEDGRGLVVALRRALSTADVDAFRRAAHSLKSTGETVGAAHLAAIARELEAAARAGRLEGAETRVSQVDSAFEIASRTLEEIRRGLPG